MADVIGEQERKIVVAVDEGEESLHALRWCLENFVPGHPRNKLILLYARPLLPSYSVLDNQETTAGSRRYHPYAGEMDYIPNWEVPETGGYIFSKEVTATMDQYSRDIADSVLRKAQNICKGHSNITIEAKTCNGDARDVICDAVDKLGADVLVMGSHGYGFIKRAFIGSVSDYCARNAKCPVLIVKRPAQ